MRKIIFIGIFVLFAQFGCSQVKTEPNPTEIIMGKTSILGLRTTIYKVNDIEKAKEWYEKAIETKAYFDDPHNVGFNNSGYELGLQTEESPKGEKIESVVTYWGDEKSHDVYE